jgi:phosphopantothenoylcysteine decarboxylase/phosphopantothenate--cysteine ligase
VTLVVGHISVPLPHDPRLEVVVAETTAEMAAAVYRAVESADALVMAAAVADFRPRRPTETKLTRDEGLTLELEPTEDILAGVRERVSGPLRGRQGPVLVGFAAETGSLDRAPEKLRRKGVDYLVANDVSEEGSGFGTDTNRVVILGADGSRAELALQSKRAVADEILDRVAAALDERNGAAQTAPMTEETRA